MSSAIDYIKDNILQSKLLAGAAVFATMFCIVLSIHITLTFENPVNYQAHIISTHDYPWIALDLETQVNMDEYFVELRWGETENARMQLFDNPVNTPPSDSFGGHERIPVNARKMRFDFSLLAPIDINLWLFIMQFDEDGRLFEADLIEQVQTTIQFHAGSGAAATTFRRHYSFETNIHQDAKAYRVFVQARPTEEQANSSLRLTHMRINFR